MGLIAAQSADQPGQWLLECRNRQPNDLWVRKKVVKERADVLNSFWPPKVEEDDSDTGQRSDLSVAREPNQPLDFSDLGRYVPPMAALPAESLEQLNSGLRSAGVRLRLEQRGTRLGLRGPLPRRDGRSGLQVQRLSLGLPATFDGLGQALERLHQVHQQVQQSTFQWPDRLALESSIDPASGLEGVLKRFEDQFHADPRRRRQPAGSRSTWTSAYRPYLRRLAAQGQPRLSVPLLEQVLESYPLASRARQQCGLVLSLLARQEELQLPADWNERAAGYGLHQARFRQLPSDTQILELVDSIPNPGWRLVFGLMATYGLRNHEVFFTDFSGLDASQDGVVRVLPTTKTGEHQVWPFLPEWVDRFALRPLAQQPALLPQISTDLRRTTLQQVGRRVAEQFRRYGLPLTPYDLRHAWALRTIHMGLPDTVAARMMGHSVAIHTRTYHHWITRRDQQQAVDAALARRGA